MQPPAWPAADEGGAGRRGRQAGTAAHRHRRTRVPGGGGSQRTPQPEILMANTVAPVLELSGIHKEFPGVKALSEAGLRLYPGEVHTLMGQNGAGKSTLIKVLTGVHAPDRGSIVMEGREIRPGSTHEAQDLGISTV